ncbi:hypothetical protein MAHJHV48_14760 [Mycobacterium avium subsp. hominissuis]
MDDDPRSGIDSVVVVVVVLAVESEGALGSAGAAPGFRDAVHQESDDTGQCDYPAEGFPQLHRNSMHC